MSVPAQIGEFMMRSNRARLGGVSAIAAVACVVAALAAAVAAVIGTRPQSPRHGVAPAAGSRHLYAYGSRGVMANARSSETKFDGALAELSRYAPLARPDHLLADLHSMSPAARLRPSSATGEPEVLVDAVTRGDPGALRAALVGLGMEHPAVFSNDVGGWLPVSRLHAAAARAEVLGLRASMPHRRAAVALQGDFAQRSDVIRSTYPSLDGTGVTVGIISDSFDCYSVYAAPGSGVPASGNQGYAYNGFTATAADDIATGALPASVNVLAEPYAATSGAPPAGNCLNYGAPTQLPFSDEGRAMLQIVHVVAPGASLAFDTGDDSEASFAAAITTLAGAGANVIADDLGYFDEPFYQDGIVAQAIDTVVSQGVAYFSAAGNDGNAAYENTAPNFSTLAAQNAPSNAGEYLLNFDTSGATTATSLPITLAPLIPGQFVGVVVEWDQPYVTGAPTSAGATSQIDVCVTGATSAYLIQDYAGNTTTCTGANATGMDPVQILIIGNPANASGNTAQETLNVVVGLANGTKAPGRIIVSIETDGQTSPAPITQFATNSATLQGHPGAAGAAAVGAAFYFDTPQCGTTPAQLEAYSAEGGAPILFDVSGNRLATPMVRQKPDFIAPDGVNDTFLGFTLASGGETGNNGLLPTSTSQCQNAPAYPNFFGTSAATPHAAGIAALMLQANSAITPAQIYSALRTSALPMTGSGVTPNFNSGYGFIQADAALALLAPAAPTLSISPTSVTVGGAATLTWASTNTTGCTASGAWTGSLGTTGSQSVTPTASGTDSYSLTCTNAAATSPAATATLTVTPATNSSSSSSSGGSSSSSSSGGSSSSSSSSGGSGGGGGGGDIDLATLAGLAALLLVRGTARRRE
jgi:hypothetical protein